MVSMVDTVKAANDNEYAPFRLHIYHRLSLLPVYVEKMSRPYGPSNLTV